MSNPFRKKTLGTIDTSRTRSPKSSMRSDDLIASGDRKSKPVKKVRVLSPPPLSPDSPEWNKLDGLQPPGTLSGDTFSYTNYYPTFDPFSGISTDESDRDSTVTPPPAPQQNQHVRDRVAINNIPANLSSKTSLEIEGSEELQKERKEGGEVLKAANAGRKSLNVDAFKNLLLTGRVGDETATSVPIIDHESLAKKSATATSTTSETNATPKITHGGYDDTSAESSESQEEDEGVPNMPHSQQIKQDRKLPPPPPPPPSSRHGKSIRQQESADVPRDAEDALSGLGVGIQSASPLWRSLDDDGQLASPRELHAGSASEVDRWRRQAEPTSPRSNTSKKPAPTPPPPRGHSRSDSKLADLEGSRRTSAEEAPLRSDGIRASGHVPAPPPPRRPHIASKQTSQPCTGPSVSSSNTAHAPTSPDQDESVDPAPPSPENSEHSPSKVSAPPPPPARHPCTRRPPSLNNVEAPSRHMSSENRSREGLPPPPPPPPRNRSGSGHNAVSLKKPPEAHLPANSGKSADILADLNALQREVDALRGKMN